MRDEAPRTATILLVTPDRPSQQRLDMLAADGFEYLVADTPDAALRLLQDHFIEVVLCPTDDTMPEGTGLLRDVAARWPDTIRIGVTDAPDAPDIPDDLFQVIPPDLDPRALSRIVRSATQLFNARRDTDRMALEMRFMTQKRGAPVPPPNRAADEGMGFEALLRGPQSPLNATIATARQLASFDVPILISGETGTGKSRLARAIHDSSLRSDKPFFALNCSGLTDEQMKAELLGIRMNGAGRIGLIQKTGRGTLYLGGLDTLHADTQLWLSRMLTEEAVILPGN
ncbi:MAG: sigma 54-interacting transcriptional regulator, partial [Pseudomonadota bacterium]